MSWASLVSSWFDLWLSVIIHMNEWVRRWWVGNTYVCVNAHMDIYFLRRMHKHTLTHLRTHIHFDSLTHTHRHAHNPIHTHTRTHTHIHTHTHKHTHTPSAGMVILNTSLTFPVGEDVSLLMSICSSFIGAWRPACVYAQYMYVSIWMCVQYVYVYVHVCV